MHYSKKIVLTLALFMGFSQAFAQTFLNGSFEATTASFACNYNLNNGVFNGFMSDVVAFGAANETDILVEGCYTTGIPDGDRAIGIAGFFDEVALELSAPLVTGESYTISFWSYSEITFRVRGDVEIGCSTSSTTFGTAVYTAVTVESTWVNHEFTFVAPNDATHITVRNVASGEIHWNHIDNFLMIVPDDPLEITSTNVSCFGACDGTATVEDGIEPPYTYLWDAAAGGATTATVTDLCAGTYSVDVTNGAGVVETLDVTITEPDEIVGTIVDQTNVTCFGGTDGSVTMDATGGVGVLTFDMGAGAMDPAIFDGLAAGSYTVVIEDETGCTVDFPVDITEPEELVAVEVSTTDLLCNGDDDGALEVSATGGTGAYSYSLDGGAYGPSGIFGTLTAGTYTITVQDENLCEASIDVTLTEPELLVVDESSTGEICEGDCVGTIDLSASGGVAPYTYSIDGCASSDGVGAYTDLCAADYPVCVEDANGCVYTSNLTVAAGGAPLDASMDAIGPMCLNDAPVPITAADMGVIAGTGIVGSMFDPATAGVGTHTITNTIADGCGGFGTMDIVVNPLPNVSFTADNLADCIPAEVTFTNTGDAGVSCEWNFGDGSISTLCGGTSHTFDIEGVYDIRLIITDANGCSNSVEYEDYIEAYGLPQANFVFDPITTTVLDTEIDFTDLSIDADSWNWTFESVGNSIAQNPTVVFPEQVGNYDVELIVATEHGCRDTIVKRLIIAEEELIYVPNTITPDGDNLNEVFRPYLNGIDIYDYHLTIYNRWGEILFESYDPSKGWNGTYGRKSS